MSRFTCFFLGKFQYLGKCAGEKYLTNIMFGLNNLTNQLEGRGGGKGGSFFINNSHPIQEIEYLSADNAAKSDSQRHPFLLV